MEVFLLFLRTDPVHSSKDPRIRRSLTIFPVFRTGVLIWYIYIGGESVMRFEMPIVEVEKFNVTDIITDTDASGNWVPGENETERG